MDLYEHDEAPPCEGPWYEDGHDYECDCPECEPVDPYAVDGMQDAEGISHA